MMHRVCGLMEWSLRNPMVSGNNASGTQVVTVKFIIQGRSTLGRVQENDLVKKWDQIN